MPRIALIHAVTVAVDPIREAFGALWPEAELVNLLDDSLSPDRARDDALTAAMTARIHALGAYALTAGADAILYTCSAFGPAIEEFAASVAIPVLKPNEAMFDEAIQRGRKIGMLATFGPSVSSMESEFADTAAALGSQASIRTVLIEPAMTALKRGDVDTHNLLLADGVSALAGVDAIMLAHFSTARALQAVSAQAACPVLTSPHSAVRALQARLARRH